MSGPFDETPDQEDDDSLVNAESDDIAAGDEGAAPGARVAAGTGNGGDDSPPDAGRTGETGGEGELFQLHVDDDLSNLERLLGDDFARISAERDEYLDALKRLQADFDNFRKRAERQQAELRVRASEALVLKLLPVLDSLDLAMTHLGLGAEPPADDAAASLVQISAQLRDILAREGVERIDSVGVGFDPTVHEATAMDETIGENEEAAGDPATEAVEHRGPTVTEVWRSGYRMGDRVIRPAMVRVRA